MNNTIEKTNIEQIINLHSAMKNSYFWNPPANANGRRNYEKSRSMKIEGIFANNEIKLECSTSCSCKNIYYKGYFFINGQRKTIAAVKKLIAA